MIVNDLFHNLGRTKKCLIWPYMIVNDLQSLGRSYTYVFNLFSIIVNDLYKASNVQLFYYLVLMIVNDLLQSLSRPNMCLI